MKYIVFFNRNFLALVFNNTLWWKELLKKFENTTLNLYVFNIIIVRYPINIFIVLLSKKEKIFFFTMIKNFKNSHIIRQNFYSFNIQITFFELYYIRFINNFIIFLLVHDGYAMNKNSTNFSED